MMLRAAVIPPDAVLEELRTLGSRFGLLAGVRSAPPDEYDVPVAGLGNVSETDARRLVRALAERIGDIPAPVIRFEGPELHGPDVLAPLAGEADELTAIARLVAEIAASVQLYVDRRRFRPALTMASVADPSAQGLLAGMPAWSGMPWEAGGISLIRTRWFAGSPRAEEFAFVELGHPLDHAQAHA
jgi:2'-5' RNA ligase